MKIVSISLLLIFSFLICFCQKKSSINLVGIWQADTTIVGSAWSDNYQFFPNGSFIFNFNEYNLNKRLDCLKGRFRLDEDTLFLRVEVTIEITGGNLIRGATSWEDEWFFDNIKKTERNNENLIEYKILLNKCGYNSLFPCMTLDNRKYFKLSSDPDNYYK